MIPGKPQSAKISPTEPQPKKGRPDPNRFEFGQEVWISQLILDPRHE